MGFASFQSYFGRIFDVVIFGAGYSAFGAALRAREDGKSVCLVNRQADLLWESGRAFMPHSGTADVPLWNRWTAILKARNSATDTEIDGALAEIIATDHLTDKNIAVLYYSVPVAAETEGDILESVIVATKSGFQRLVARQWIDATEKGEVLGLLNSSFEPKTPVQRHLFAYYQHLSWPNQETAWPGGCRRKWTEGRWK